MRCIASRLLYAGVAILVIVFAGPVNATDWNLSPSASISQIFTDNVNLAPSGQEESEVITNTNVGFRADRSGPRLDLNAAYNLQNVFYWRDTRDDETFHQFAGNGNLEVLDDRFFLDASAAYSQRFVSPRDAVGDNIIGADERTDVATYRVSPYWRERYGSFAESEVRYIWEKVDVQRGTRGDPSSEADRWRAFLASGPDFGRVGWRLSYSLDEVDFDDGSAVTFESAEALASLRITPQFSVFAAGGREWNDFEVDPSRAEPDDEFWRAGATWTPTVRTFMEAFYGERFFGKTYGASLRHQFRRSQVAIDYTEAPTTLTNVIFTPTLFLVVDEFGDPILVDGDPLFLDFELPELVSDVYIAKRLTVSASGSGVRTRWVLRGFDERREYQVDPRDEHVYGVGATFSRRLTSDSTALLDLRWQEANYDNDPGRDDERVYGIRGSYTWRVAPRTRGNVQTSWQRSEFDIDNREEDLWTAGIGLSASLGRRTTASVNYRYSERDSTRADRDFQENRITLTLGATF
ncbi:MAG: TIGR03016 family PEP-CTERM system-associated outer membrane protein [Gammaproteobacteria bacterium]|nr:MAG: TIGR03016 family PEP-CTERM system-associated outer membrane protein [Gammaproteobacteria bacterium]